MNTTAITAGSKVKVVKGCAARGVAKGSTAMVRSVEVLGAEHGHAVRVVLWFVNSFISGKTFAFYVRHANRLADPIVSMNDGRPEHRIEVRRA